LQSAPTPVERGRLLYAQYGCVLCHGADGKGGFPNPNAETDGKVPAVIYVAEGYTESELRRMILDGARSIGRADLAGPTPPYRMPGWRGHMTAQEVDDLVQYLLSLYPISERESWR
jgi:mono/diheme cytochrome c family protein